MSQSEKLITPLAQIVLERKGLSDEIDKLCKLAELEFVDMGDDLDAICALRDTFIYLAAKVREDRTANVKGKRKAR
jgi:hypothetical protein